MISFENYERKIDKIQAVLAKYKIKDLEEARELCRARGFDPYEIVRNIQPICFDDACWAYTAGAAIALRRDCRQAADAAEAIGVGSCRLSACRALWPKTERWVWGTAIWPPCCCARRRSASPSWPGTSPLPPAEGAIGIARSAN